MENRLFIGVYPAALVYADRSKEKNGDYMTIAMLPYDSLELRICEPDSDLLPEIKESAAKYNAGDKLQISASGQYIVLGS